jgi:hypothetical protein
MKKSSSPPKAKPRAVKAKIRELKKEEPFHKITRPDGTTDWVMGSDVHFQHEDWGGQISYLDEDVDRAKHVIMQAEWRRFGGEYIDNLPFGEEFTVAYHHFIVPIAERLNGIGWASPEEAERMKKTALHWVSLILDEAFPPLSLKARRVLNLIRIAHSLCRKLDRLPYKKEVWSEARRRDAKTFTLGEDTEGDLLKMADLDNLPQARRGKK